MFEVAMRKDRSVLRERVRLAYSAHRARSTSALFSVVGQFPIIRLHVHFDIKTERDREQAVETIRTSTQSWGPHALPGAPGYSSQAERTL